MADENQWPDMIADEAVTIASGASLSAAVNLGGGSLVGIQMPDSAAWTTANLTFQGSYDGTTFENLYDSVGTEVSITAAADRYIVLNPATFAGVKVIKVRSGTSGTPVNQGADRVLQLVLRAI